MLGRTIYSSTGKAEHLAWTATLTVPFPIGAWLAYEWIDLATWLGSGSWQKAGIIGFTLAAVVFVEAILTCAFVVRFNSALDRFLTSRDCFRIAFFAATSALAVIITYLELS